MKKILRMLHVEDLAVDCVAMVFDRYKDNWIKAMECKRRGRWHLVTKWAAPVMCQTTAFSWKVQLAKQPWPSFSPSLSLQRHQLTFNRTNPLLEGLLMDRWWSLWPTVEQQPWDTFSNQQEARSRHKNDPTCQRTNTICCNRRETTNEFYRVGKRTALTKLVRKWKCFCCPSSLSVWCLSVALNSANSHRNALV